VSNARTCIVALSLFTVACDKAEPLPAAAAAEPDVAAALVTPLDTTATPLREWFEANAGKPRFITLVSPT
jgi:hypothetical protein